MEFAFLGTETAEGWEEWHGTNVDVSNGMVRLAKEPTSAYVSPEPVIADPPPSFTPVDIDLDECGDLYVLTAEGQIYRYDHEQATLRRLPCLWYPEATPEDAGDESREPVALCVTEDSIYVADGAIGGVLAFSKHRYQLRWRTSEPFEDPVALVADGRTGYVLDRGSAGGDGFVVRLGATGAATENAVSGLETPATKPADVAVGPDGDLYVLDWQVTGEENDGDDSDEEDDLLPVVRRFSSTGPAGQPFTERAGDAVRIPPEYKPRCIEVVIGRQIFVGTDDPELVRRTYLYRYLPAKERFERMDSVTEPCSRLLLRRRKSDSPGRGLYVMSAIADETGDDERSEIYFLDEVRRYRFNAETDGYDAHARRRFDSGEPGTEWHRVTMGLHVDGAGTQVRLHYRATERAEVGELEDFGIDPVYADRLREANVTGAWGLVELRPEKLAELVSVPRDRTAGWIDRAWQVVDETVDRGIETIHGIGPTFGGRLRDANVRSVVDLIELGPEAIAAITEAPPAETENWLERARGVIDDTVGTDWAEAVGLDPTSAARLRGAGVTRLSALIAHTPASLADRLRVSTDLTERWLERARNRIDAEWSGHGASASVANPRDALLDAAEGRYLWVRIELLGSESSSPGVDSFRVYFPRQSYLRYLPGIYREDAESAEFLERFLSIFESTFVDIEEDIRSVTKYLDACGIPADYLAWLGEWLAVNVDETWPESVQRTFIDRAPDLFKKRGTREGLLEMLTIYLGESAVLPAAWEAALERERERIRERVDRGELTTDEATEAVERMTRSAYLLEYSDLDCIDEEAAKRPYAAQLGCPQCFLVQIPPFADDEQMRAIDRIVESGTPAHAIGRAVRLRPWIQLGGESHPGNTYLGINSALAEGDFVLEESTLGTDSVLGEREEFSQLEVKSRLGTDTIIS